MPNKKRTEKKSHTKKTKKHESSDKRSIWKGYITFGLVNIPVVLYSAEKPQQEVHFKLLDKKDLAGIHYARINEKTGKEVPWENIVKGYEYEPETYAIITDEDFDAIARENIKAIEIEDFVDINELGTMYFKKPYYLVPSARGEKGYVLLRETLKTANKVGIARVMIRSHQYLAAVMAEGPAIIINTIRYPQEIKDASEMDLPEGSASSYKISKKESDIAKQLVDTMTTKWDPQNYTNEYREDLLKLIEEKIASRGKKTLKHVEKTEHIKKTNVIDFMDLLKKSVKAKKGQSTPSKKKKGKSSGSKDKKGKT